MRCLSPGLVTAATLAASCALVSPAVRAQGTPRVHHPTPHEAITEALVPLESALADLHATDVERGSLGDLFAQGETWAAEQVEASHRGDPTAVRVRIRWINLLARVAHGRIEALRAEAAAADAQRAEVSADAQRVQSRAAVERTVERRIALDRTDGINPQALPPPDSTRPQPEGPAHAASPRGTR